MKWQKDKRWWRPYIDDPKEAQFTSIQVNQSQLLEIKRSQDEMKTMLKDSMSKIALFTDMANAFSTLKLESQPTETETNLIEGKDSTEGKD